MVKELSRNKLLIPLYLLIKLILKYNKDYDNQTAVRAGSIVYVGSQEHTKLIWTIYRAAAKKTKLKAT